MITEEKTGTIGTIMQPRVVIAIEGNGSRPSHHGNGYRVGGAMFTLNATEVHGVAYEKVLCAGEVRNIHTDGEKHNAP